MARCPYCESTKSLLMGQVFCSRHTQADMTALRSGTLYIRTRKLEETADHISRLSIRLMLNGHQWYSVDGADRLVHRDNFLVIDQGQHYRTAFTAEHDLEMLMVGFRPGLAQDVSRSLTIGNDRLLDDPLGDADGMSLAAQTYPRDAVISGLFARLHHLVRTGAGIHQMEGLDAVHDRLMERLIELQSGVRLKIEGLAMAKRSTRLEIWKRLNHARQFAEAHHGQPLAVADLAREACLSLHHFKRLFREAFGAPPHRYLRKLRMERARDLLVHGDTPINEVAMTVGFEDLSAFSRTYRQIMGYAPSAHRKNLSMAHRTGKIALSAHALHSWPRQLAGT